MKATNAAEIEPLVYIDDVVSYNPEDKPLFDELRDVLGKHNALNRFGISLLHQHFDIADDEVLLETTDRKERTQVIRPVKKDEISDLDYIETSWRLDQDQPTMACVCLKQNNTHTGEHRHTKWA